MDAHQVSTNDSIISVCKELEDPRDPRGVRHPWWVLVSILVAGLLSDLDHARGIAQWAEAEQELLAAWLPLPHGQAPSESTLQRTLRQLGLPALRELAKRVLGAGEVAGPLEGIALDGKTLRGASQPGAPLHVLELSRHSDGALLDLVAVGQKENEYSASPALLAGCQLVGRVVTGDAMFCQRRLATYIQRRGGHWLFQVKENQPALLAAVQAHFEAPRRGPDPLDIRNHATLGKAHGRLERRVTEASADLAEHLEWPGLVQVVRRTMRRQLNGVESLEHSYWITSLSPSQAGSAQLEQLCRSHWTIENQLHWVRDVTFGEDRGTTRSGHAPLALAWLRSLVRWLIVERAQFARVPDGRRHFRFHPEEALRLLTERL